MKSALLFAPNHSPGGENRAPAARGQGSVYRLPSRRTLTLFRIARLATATDAGLCCVRAISDTRLTLDTGLDLAAGVSVEIALSDDVTVTGVVERKEGDRVEVRFVQCIDSSGLLQSLPLQRGERRQRPPRLAVDASGIAFTELGPQPVRVLNVSQGGMQVTHDGSLRKDAAIRISLENGLARRAVVRWSRDGTAGLSFLEPLSYRQLASATRFVKRAD